MRPRIEDAEALHRKLRIHLFEFAVAAVWTLVGLQLLLEPEATALRSPVARTLAWQPVWAILEVIGGPMIIAALIGGSTRWRIAGLCLLGSALGMQGFAAATAPNPDLRVGAYWVYAIACGLRALYCYRKAR